MMLNELEKKLIKEVYDFLHDDYIITEFEDMKILQEKFLKDLVYKRFSNNNFTEKNTYRGGSISSIKYRYKEFDESKFDEELKDTIKEIKNGTIHVDVIYDVLEDLNLDFEIDGDLFDKKKSFLDIYRVFDNGYRYL